MSILPGIMPTIDLGHGRSEREHNPGLMIFALLILFAFLRGGRGGLLGGCDGDGAGAFAAADIGEIKGGQKALTALAAERSLDATAQGLRDQIGTIPARSAMDTKAVLCEPLCAIESGVLHTVKDAAFERGVGMITNQNTADTSALMHRMDRGFCNTDSIVNTTACATNNHITQGFCDNRSHIDHHFCATNAAIKEGFYVTNRNIDDKYNLLSRQIQDTATTAALAAKDEEIERLRRERDHERTTITVTNNMTGLINTAITPILTALSNNVTTLNSGLSVVADAVARLRATA